jgi:hypothetical protein
MWEGEDSTLCPFALKGMRNILISGKAGCWHTRLDASAASRITFAEFLAAPTAATSAKRMD